MWHTLRRIQSEVVEADRIANGSLLLLKGDAGTGKTHLLCDFASARIESGVPTVLLMGQRFNGRSDPWTQVLQQVGMQDSNTEKFVGALEAAAQSANRRALVIVDALNEGGGRSIWPVHLAAFLARLEQSPWIATLLSVRTTYADVVIPEDVRDRSEQAVHRGFGGKEYDAVQAFFSHYGIELPSVPILRPEFSNPLFLKMVCVGLSESGEVRLPRGFHGITMAFQFYLDAVNERLAKILDYNPNDRLVHGALDRLAELQVAKNERWPSREKTEAIVNALLPRESFSSSLYRAMVDEGVLMEDMRWSADEVSAAAFSSSQGFTDRTIAVLKGTTEALVTAWKRLTSWKKDGVTAQTLTPRQRSGSAVVNDLTAVGPPSPYSELTLAEVPEEVVSIAYDRFADHIIAERLLSSYLDLKNPERVFREGGELAGLWQERNYNHVGLIEAMSVQVPEMTSMELVTLAPEIRNTPYFAESFMQSIVWRRLDAMAEDTREVFDQIVKDHDDSPYVLDTLLTVSTIPHHKFNAEFLDSALRHRSMPDRDAWWSTYLHRAYGEGGAVDRLLDWAQGQSKSDSVNIEPQVIDLAAVTLAWMLTTSNRFLRDRATKALVSLLTDRLQSTERLVDRFADVDDPYVTERIYAVAYGVAMRSHDQAGVGGLASKVYEKIFASGSPPAHILLRDYARGVVERAVHLDSDIDVDIEVVRPPYKSEWPSIPEEHVIQSLTPGWDRGAWRSGDLEWSRNRIRRSVMNDDFAIYIIGTNWGGSDWLSLCLSDRPWRSPDQRTAIWLQKLSAPERTAWEELTKIKLEQPIVLDLGDGQPTVLFRGDKSTEVDQREIEGARRELETAQQKVKETITEDHLTELESIDQARANGPPYFDLGTIQRHVLWRVFDLGWTVDRFGYFDRFSIGYSGREPGKPERIGKKYQWIAYHEILSYISDHYQHLNRYGEVSDNRAFRGTWQGSLRNIDLSNTLSSIPGGTRWRGHTAAWWGSSSYADWNEELGHQDWIACKDDIPNIANQLVVTSPDGTRWVNVCGQMSWQQTHSADVEPAEVDKREIWLHFTGYFVRAKDVYELMDWAITVDFWGRWMPEPPNVYFSDMFLGEYGWAPAFWHSDRQFYLDHGGGEWIKPKNKAPAYVQPAASEHSVESGGYDCSVVEGYSLQLPHQRLLNSLQLRWSGQAGDYLDGDGNLAVFDPTAHEDGPSALLVREDLLRQFLAKEGLALCWTILGEKRVLGSIIDLEHHGSLKISGAYRYTDQGPEGSLNFNLEIPSDETDT